MGGKGKKSKAMTSRTAWQVREMQRDKAAEEKFQKELQDAVKASNSDVSTSASSDEENTRVLGLFKEDAHGGGEEEDFVRAMKESEAMAREQYLEEANEREALARALKQSEESAKQECSSDHTDLEAAIKKSLMDISDPSDTLDTRPDTPGASSSNTLPVSMPDAK